MNEIIKTLLNEWLDRKLPEVRQRISLRPESVLSISPNKIIALSGFRRTGKTFFLIDIALKLLENNSRRDIVYLNFEDERIPHQTDFLTRLLPAIKENSGQIPEFFLMDEIHLIPDWSRWVRRIYDTYSVKFFLTGSSSKMTTDEIPTELRGRFLERRVHPLSFNEFLDFKAFPHPLKNIEYQTMNFPEFTNALKEYMVTGGLPEVALAPPENRREIIQSYFKTVVSRDISERYDIRNDALLKALIKLLLNSRTITITKLSNTLKSLHFKAGKHTITDYLLYIEKALFFRLVTCFSYKIKDELKHPRKVYCVDNGFITSVSVKLNNEFGYLAENLVAQHLNRYVEEINFWKSVQDGYEVDFVLKEVNKITQLIQVCYDISNEETFNREVRALVLASKELKCKNILLINSTEDKIEKINWFGIKATVRLVPLWKWLLGKPEEFIS